MRLSRLSGFAFTVLLAACSSSVHQAEVLSTPIPGVVLAAKPVGHKCMADGCRFTFRLQLTNPMERDVSVEDCAVVNQALNLPIMGQPGGAGLSAGQTLTLLSGAVLPIKRKDAQGLVGSDISCTGLDWHGHAPI